jgi:hypothetical protein
MLSQARGHLEIDPPLAGGCVVLTVARCFKVQVESDFDKGKRDIHGSCMVGVHMEGVEFLHQLGVIRFQSR